MYTGKFLFGIENNSYSPIAWIIVFFSFFAYGVYYLSFPFKESQSILKKYEKFFPYFIIPQTVVLWYSICIRIENYGPTANRYLAIFF